MDLWNFLGANYNNSIKNYLIMINLLSFEFTIHDYLLPIKSIQVEYSTNR